MSALADEKVLNWASEWADKFDQNWSEEKLSEWVGQQVRLTRPATEDEEPKGVTGTVVGYSIDTLCFVPGSEGERLTTRRYSFILAEGQQVGIFSEMQVEAVE